MATRSAIINVMARAAEKAGRGLIRDFGQGCDVRLVGAVHLAGFAERVLRGDAIDDDAVAREIAPCFVANEGRRTDTIVLGCTHYPLLIDRLVRLAPWPVDWVYPAPAIARRMMDLIGPPSANAASGTARAIFTSGLEPPPALAAALARFGIRETAAAS